MPKFDPALAAKAIARCPRYYAQCVLACDREYTPVRWSIVSGPYPNLIGAWIAAAILRDEYPDIVWIAGEMYVGEDL
jgi:hypothetical protein